MDFNNCDFDKDEWLMMIAKLARDLTPESRECYKDAIKEAEHDDVRELYEILCCLKSNITLLHYLIISYREEVT